MPLGSAWLQVEVEAVARQMVDEVSKKTGTPPSPSPAQRHRPPGCATRYAKSRSSRTSRTSTGGRRLGARSKQAQLLLLLTIYPEPHCVREVREVAPACPRSLRPDSRPASPSRVGPELCALCPISRPSRRDVTKRPAAIKIQRRVRRLHRRLCCLLSVGCVYARGSSGRRRPPVKRPRLRGVRRDRPSAIPPVRCA